MKCIDQIDTAKVSAAAARLMRRGMPSVDETFSVRPSATYDPCMATRMESATIQGSWATPYTRWIPPG